MNNQHIAIIAFSILLGLIIAMTIQVDKVNDQYNELADRYNEECIIDPEFEQNTLDYGLSINSTLLNAQIG